jgi:alpha-ribazole phosphatase
VRHAQPVVAPGVCYGALDLAADAGATLQAAQQLAKALPPGIAVRSSPLQRCEQFAKAVCGLRPDLTSETDARLVELDFGVLEGVAWDAIDKASIDAWTADFWLHRFGGHESVSDLMLRVGAAWDQWRAQTEPQVWITHAGVIRAVHLLSQGVRRIDHAADWPSQTPAFGQWQQITR